MTRLLRQPNIIIITRPALLSEITRSAHDLGTAKERKERPTAAPYLISADRNLAAREYNTRNTSPLVRSYTHVREPLSEFHATRRLHVCAWVSLLIHTPGCYIAAENLKYPSEKEIQSVITDVSLERPS